MIFKQINLINNYILIRILINSLQIIKFLSNIAKNLINIKIKVLMIYKQINIINNYIIIRIPINNSEIIKFFNNKTSN